MKKLVIAIALSAISFSAISADKNVSGYTRKDGTYVEPYHRTESNSTKNDNYSTRGNTNPYTGAEGTKQPDQYNTYGSPQQPKRTPY